MLLYRAYGCDQFDCAPNSSDLVYGEHDIPRLVVVTVLEPAGRVLTNKSALYSKTVYGTDDGSCCSSPFAELIVLKSCRGWPTGPSNSIEIEEICHDCSLVVRRQFAS